ncbi:hypothetical protein HY745_06670 [Candidatus Desantisbacteria bacterium]|nr:hypothetical protein [Candidatus Desantisbacteria bacterium]
MEEGHTESHEGSHHEIVHHEPGFKQKVVTFIWFICMFIFLVQLFSHIGNHVANELFVEIKNFLAH